MGIILIFIVKDFEDKRDVKCIEPFGVALGQDSTGTVGYSNCNN